MTSIAELYGLVLSGGKSTRMGKDKGLISYHGLPQREYLYDLLHKVCGSAFISARPDQKNELPNGLEVIYDEGRFRGPFNGLLSAYNKFPEVAWLVLACDLPLIGEKSLHYLIAERDPKVFATSYAQSENPLPEPLCAIWEPKALKRAIHYLEAGNGTCPRKFLIHNEVKLVFPKDCNILLNANSEEDYQEALSKLTSS